MKQKIIDLFQLTAPVTRSDIKKAYRRLAHQHHPDHFSDSTRRAEQSGIMSGITEAYQQLLHQLSENKGLSEPAPDSPDETDYGLYKQALEYYQTYFDTFFKVFSERKLIEVDEKEQCLQTARNLFSRLLLQYPDSDWSDDSRFRIDKIDRAIESLYK